MREVRENEVCLGYTKPKKCRSSRLDTRSNRLDQALKTFCLTQSPGHMIQLTGSSFEKVLKA